MGVALLRTFVRRAPPWIAACALACQGAASAQIYKCVDRTGHTTYQQTPCPSSARGGRVELDIDNGATREGVENEATWEAAAHEKNVIVGMPRRYVRIALGAPVDARPGRADDNAAEVWSYARPDGMVLRVGFRNGFVAWTRHDSAEAAAAPMPDDEATQRVLRRRSLAEGQDCATLNESLGAPDRTETQSATSADQSGVTRHTWEPAPGDPYARTIVTCTAGRISYVERVTAR